MVKELVLKYNQQDPALLAYSKFKSTPPIGIFHFLVPISI